MQQKKKKKFQQQPLHTVQLVPPTKRNLLHVPAPEFQKWPY